jgi:carboxymethylenebutenolidase
MCSDPNSTPPIAPAADTRVEGRRTELEATDGTHFSVFQAEAPRPTGAGIIVLPDYYGLTGFYEELATRFAEIGVDAIAVDYYARTAAPPPRDRSFDHVSHAEQTTWTGLQADVTAAADELRASRGVKSLFSVGFCFGGRASFLLGTLSQLQMAGVIGFYGWPVGTIANDMPAPADIADRLVAPLLGVFGGADTKITPQHVIAFEDALDEAQADHRLVSYRDAPHSFFDRKHGEFGEESASAWSEVRTFIEAHAAT